MKQIIFLFKTLFLCFLGILLLYCFADKTTNLLSRSFTFTYSVEIQPTNNKKLELWLPIPQSNEVQTISNLNLNTNGLNYNIKQEKINDDSTDLYEAGSFINNSLSLKDKLDFISCIYEVAYADNNMHFIERHIIKQIINILNINKDELKKIKKDLL